MAVFEHLANPFVAINEIARVVDDGVHVVDPDLGLAVAQDARLFIGTVAENIRFDRDGIADDSLREAAARAHVASDIETMPEGFDTHLGERRSKLSGGSGSVCRSRERSSVALSCSTSTSRRRLLTSGASR